MIGVCPINSTRAASLFPCMMKTMFDIVIITDKASTASRTIVPRISKMPIKRALTDDGLQPEPHHTRGSVRGNWLELGRAVS